MNVPSRMPSPRDPPGGRGAITACRLTAIDLATGTPCSIVRCVTRCMIRLRHDLKDGTMYRTKTIATRVGQHALFELRQR